nr:hypothetical protein [Amylibacter sp.]
MPYDYQLVSGTVLILLGLVGVTNAMVEKRSPLFGMIGTLSGIGLVVWAWIISGQTLTSTDLTHAVYRLLAEWK